MPVGNPYSVRMNLSNCLQFFYMVQCHLCIYDQYILTLTFKPAHQRNAPVKWNDYGWKYYRTQRPPINLSISLRTMSVAPLQRHSGFIEGETSLKDIECGCFLVVLSVVRKRLDGVLNASLLKKAIDRHFQEHFRGPWHVLRLKRLILSRKVINLESLLMKSNKSTTEHAIHALYENLIH